MVIPHSLAQLEQGFRSLADVPHWQRFQTLSDGQPFLRAQRQYFEAKQAHVAISRSSFTQTQQKPIQDYEQLRCGSSSQSPRFDSACAQAMNVSVEAIMARMTAQAWCAQTVPIVVPHVQSYSSQFPRPRTILEAQVFSSESDAQRKVTADSVLQAIAHYVDERNKSGRGTPLAHILTESAIARDKVLRSPESAARAELYSISEQMGIDNTASMAALTTGVLDAKSGSDSSDVTRIFAARAGRALAVEYARANGIPSDDTHAAILAARKHAALMFSGEGSSQAGASDWQTALVLVRCGMWQEVADVLSVAGTAGAAAAHVARALARTSCIPKLAASEVRQEWEHAPLGSARREVLNLLGLCDPQQIGELSRKEPHGALFHIISFLSVLQPEQALTMARETGALPPLGSDLKSRYERASTLLLLRHPETALAILADGASSLDAVALLLGILDAQSRDRVAFLHCSTPGTASSILVADLPRPRLALEFVFRHCFEELNAPGPLLLLATAAPMAAIRDAARKELLLLVSRPQFSWMRSQVEQYYATSNRNEQDVAIDVTDHPAEQLERAYSELVDLISTNAVPEYSLDYASHYILQKANEVAEMTQELTTGSGAHELVSLREFGRLLINWSRARAYLLVKNTEEAAFSLWNTGSLPSIPDDVPDVFRIISSAPNNFIQCFWAIARDAKTLLCVMCGREDFDQRERALDDLCCRVGNIASKTPDVQQGLPSTTAPC